MADSKSSQSGKSLQSTAAPPPDPPVPLLELDMEPDDDEEEVDDDEDDEEADCSPPWPPSLVEDEVCPSSQPRIKEATRSGRVKIPSVWRVFIVPIRSKRTEKRRMFGARFMPNRQEICFFWW
mgnify:CR=1 FL=1